MPRHFIYFEAERRHIIRFENPSLECPGENYTLFFHSATITPTVLAAFLCHSLPSSSLAQGLWWKFAPILAQSITEVTVLLCQTRGRSSPHRGVPPNHSLVPQSCSPKGQVVVCRSTGLDKVLVDVLVPSPDSNVSGVWVGSDRDQYLKKFPVNLATQPGWSS